MTEIFIICQVSAVYLEQMCPPPSCPNYNPILNTFKSEGDQGFVLEKFNNVSCQDCASSTLRW